MAVPILSPTMIPATHVRQIVVHKPPVSQITRKNRALAICIAVVIGVARTDLQPSAA